MKSLAPFPDVLKLLNNQLEWTQRLGDAVLAQQADVLNAVQALRGRARAAGARASNPQQTVTVTQNAAAAVPGAGAPAPAVPPPPQVIAIEPAQPDMVYVPAYDPAVVYGPWPYPTYPPPYYPPPPAYGVGAALLTGMAFAGGAAIVGSLWGWGRPAWGRGDVDVNVNRYNNINANRTQISGNAWQHDVSHRHGVAYRNSEVTNGFGGGERATQAQGRERFRGRVDQAGLGARPAGRPGLGDRRSGGADRAGLADRRPAGNRGPATATPVEQPSLAPGGELQRAAGSCTAGLAGDRPG